MSGKTGFDRWLAQNKSPMNSATTPSPLSTFRRNAKKTETRRLLKNFSEKHIEAQQNRHYQSNPFMKKKRTQRRKRDSPSQTWRSVSSKEAQEMNLMKGGKRR